MTQIRLGTLGAATLAAAAIAAPAAHAESRCAAVQVDSMQFTSIVAYESNRGTPTSCATAQALLRTLASRTLQGKCSNGSRAVGCTIRGWSCSLSTGRSLRGHCLYPGGATVSFRWRQRFDD